MLSNNNPCAILENCCVYFGYNEIVENTKVFVTIVDM